jgi:hypothetical protein
LATAYLGLQRLSTPDLRSLPDRLSGECSVYENVRLSLPKRLPLSSIIYQFLYHNWFAPSCDIVLQKAYLTYGFARRLLGGIFINL